MTEAVVAEARRLGLSQICPRANTVTAELVRRPLPVGEAAGLVTRSDEACEAPVHEEGTMPTFEPADPDFERAVRESFERLTLMHTLGAAVERVSPGEVDVALPFRSDLTQHHGFIAGAVLAAIVDVACGYAAMSLMPAGSSVLTIEYKVNFLAPARGERLVARGRVVRPGRTVSVCAGDVVAVDGDRETLVATLLATMMRVGTERLPEPSAVKDQQPGHAPAHARGARRWCICRAWTRRTLAERRR